MNKNTLKGGGGGGKKGVGSFGRSFCTPLVIKKKLAPIELAQKVR